MDNCSKCSHFKTCKYVDEALKFESKQIKDIPEFITIEIKCKYFDENKPTPKLPQEYINSPLTWVTTSTPNQCSDCDFYNNYTKKGQTYIGDVPCQWCNKSPYKITCTTTDATMKCINKIEE